MLFRKRRVLKIIPRYKRHRIGGLSESTPHPPCYHFPVRLSDTTPAAQAVQLEMHRAMSGEQKIILAFEMCEFARELNRARLRQEHPEWCEQQIARELLRLAFFPKPLPAGLK